MLSSGSRDRLILQRDARTPSPVERRLIGHRQEVSLINGSYASVEEQATTGYLQLLQSWASKAIWLGWHIPVLRSYASYGTKITNDDGDTDSHAIHCINIS